jgi:hypothetical protein
MTSPTLENLEKTIRSLKQRLARIGDMRPGTLSIQYRNPKEQQTPFHQISYTHQGKSHSQYVRPENLTAIKREIDAYRRFKSTAQELVALSIEASRLRHRPARKT